MRHSFLAKTLLSAALLAALPFAAIAQTTAQDEVKAEIKPAAKPTTSQVELRNQSRWAIKQMYFSPVGASRWGPNQISGSVIRTGDSFTLTSIECDKYDVKLVDQDNAECVVENVAVCASDKIWTLGDHDLLKCQANTTQ